MDVISASNSVVSTFMLTVRINFRSREKESLSSVPEGEPKLDVMPAEAPAPFSLAAAMFCWLSFSKTAAVSATALLSEELLPQPPARSDRMRAAVRRNEGYRILEKLPFFIIFLL